LRSWWFPVGEGGSGGSQNPEASVEGARGGQRPGEEAWEAECQQGGPKQGGAARGGKGLFVGLERVATLLKGRAADTQHGGSPARTAPDDAPAGVVV
jgi:hypothetical protein